MVTSMEEYVTLDPDDDDVDFRYYYRDTMIAQLKQDLYNKSFSLQDQGKGDQIDTLQDRKKFWLKILDMGGPIADNLWDCDYNDDVLDSSVRSAEIIPVITKLKNLLDILRYKWLRNQLNFF